MQCYYFHLHTPRQCRVCYKSTPSHTDAIRSRVLNETVWSVIAAPRTSIPPPAPFRALHTSIQLTQIQFLQARPSLFLIEEGGKEGWELRDSSIVWLPPGCKTETWTRCNHTRSTAATKVPEAPRLKNWGDFINYKTWLVHVQETHGFVRLCVLKSHLILFMRMQMFSVCMEAIIATASPLISVFMKTSNILHLWCLWKLSQRPA